MEQALSARYVTGDDVLLAYLDLCGTKFVYSAFPLEQQMERIEQVVSISISEFENVFGKERGSLYVHMYADSLVVAETQRGQVRDCATRFVDWLLRVQYQTLCDSETLEYEEDSNGSNKTQYMPTVSRGLVKRGKYFGLLFEHFQVKVGDRFFNFSLVGGSTIVEMDKALQGLPMGAYIDNSIIGEFEDKSRLVDVEGNQLRFVKPSAGFDSLRSITQGKDLDNWVSKMIQASANNTDLKNKLIPWADAIQGRSNLIGYEDGHN